MSTASKYGRRSRSKGKRGEREIVGVARSLGLEAERTWNTAQSADPTARRCDVRIAGRAAQVKRLGHGLSALYAALEGVEIAFLRQDRECWLAVLPATALFELLKHK